MEIKKITVKKKTIISRGYVTTYSYWKLYYIFGINVFGWFIPEEDYKELDVEELETKKTYGML